MPASETEAVLVTRRMTDQRKASRSNDGSTVWQRSLAGEAGDGRLAGLGVLTGVAHLLGPGQEAFVGGGSHRPYLQIGNACVSCTLS